MYKKLATSTIFFGCLINTPGYATEETEQIRKECENEVQAYGIVDQEEFQQLLNDCIASMTTQSPQEQTEDYQYSDERT